MKKTDESTVPVATPCLVEVLGPTTCAGCHGDIPTGSRCLCVKRQTPNMPAPGFYYYHADCAPTT